MAAKACSAPSNLTPRLEVRESIISSEIQRMETNVREIVRQLSLPSHDPEKLEKDARCLLNEYYRNLSHWLTHSVPGDDPMIFLSEYHSDLAEGEYPTLEEIQRCKDLIAQINRCPIDLSRIENVKTYQELAGQVQGIYSRMAQVSSDIESSMSEFLSFEEDPRTISPLELRGLKAITSQLFVEMRNLSELAGEHARGEINSFTLQHIGLYTSAAIRVNRLAQNMIGNISYIAEEQLSKLGEAATRRPFRLCSTLREIKEITRVINSHFIVDELLFNPLPIKVESSYASVKDGALVPTLISDPSGLSLRKGIRSYKDLAEEVEQIYLRIQNIGYEIGDSVSEFYTPAAEFRRMSRLEIWGLKDLTCELDEKMKIVFHHFRAFEKGEFARFTLDGQTRFTDAVRGVKQIGRQIVGPILRVSFWELSKYAEDGEPEDSFSACTLKEIKQTSSEMLGYM